MCAKDVDLTGLLWSVKTLFLGIFDTNSHFIMVGSLNSVQNWIRSRS